MQFADAQKIIRHHNIGSIQWHFSSVVHYDEKKAYSHSGAETLLVLDQCTVTLVLEAGTTA